MAKNISNSYCALSDLSNEADVETFFVSPLILSGLGYNKKQLQLKKSIEELKVSRGRRKVLYRPDFAAKVGKHIRWICDAKTPTEDLDDWLGQCMSYCHEINSRYPAGENPVEFFVLTNGLRTRVYKWDSNTPILELKFSDFLKGNKKFELLKSMLAPTVFQSLTKKAPAGETLTLRKKTANDLNADFAWCHDQIHKKDALSYTAAFMEFVKLIFLKLLSDKELHRKYPELGTPGQESIQVLNPAIEVPFSLARIASSEAVGIENPMGVQFQKLRLELEEQIEKRNKKRIFSEDETLNLSKGLIRDIVRRLESTDLYGLDADLNGRLFETFLNATLRGKALGQYFTPRSVVKLVVELADLQVSTKLDDCDVVIDACCGSGGFLIEALAAMWQKVDCVPSLSAKAKSTLRDGIATNCLYGIDSAKDPALARIARMNMYLHGDGGSSIYQLDALDKQLRSADTDSAETKAERDDFERLLKNGQNGLASVALTNPPFAREYERKKGAGSQEGDISILDDYDLASEQEADHRQAKEKLKSSVMFLERYLDFLRPGGRLITVIDDSVLGGKAFADARAWLRTKYIVEAVVSLPGDAFQRSEARVKTSVLALRKKSSPDEDQPDVFMYYCNYVGVDDPARERVLPVDERNHHLAQQEIQSVGALFKKFRAGSADAKLARWIVSPGSLSSRWDVKACLLKPGRLVKKWKAKKIATKNIGALVATRFADGKAQSGYEDRIIRPKVEPSRPITHLRISYKGFAEPGEEKYSDDADSDVLYRVSAGDLVISHINAVHGACAIVPSELAGAVVTKEYTVMSCSQGLDGRVLWALLRSPEVRSEILLRAQGIGRTRTSWNDLRVLEIPIPNDASQVAMIKLFNRAEDFETKARQERAALAIELRQACALDDPDAATILAAFKPPQ